MSSRTRELGRLIAAMVFTAVLLGGVIAMGSGAIPGVQVSSTPLDNLSVDGDIHVAISGDNTTATGDIYIRDDPPTIESPTAIDRTDGDGVVRDGDTIEVSATVFDAETGVANVTANASAFGVETVTLEPGEGDGTYTGTFTVDAGSVAEATSSPIRITATDTTGHTREASTNALELAATDTGPTACEANVSTTGRLGEEVYEMDGPLRFCDVVGGNETDGSLRVFVADGLIATDRYAQGDWIRQYFTYSGSVLVLDGEKISLGYYNAEDDPASSFSGDLDRYEPPDDQFVSEEGDAVTTVWRFEGVEVRQTVALPAENAQFYGLRWEITNRGGSTVENATFLRGADTFLGGDDFGKGFWNPDTNTVGVTDTNDGVQQRLSFRGVTPPDGYRSAFWSDVVDDVESGDLADEVTTSDHDNAYALEWRRDSIAPSDTWRIRSIESFVRSSLSVSGGATRTLDGPNETVTFDVTALGDEAVTVDYGVSCPAGFTCTVPDSETIEPGTTATVNVTVEAVGDVDRGTYEVVLAAGAPDIQPVQGTSLIEVPGAFFELTGLTGTASASTGDPTTVTAEVTNTGEEAGEQTIEFGFAGASRDRVVSLAVGESRTLAFTAPAPPEPGVSEATVRTDDDIETIAIETVDREFVCGRSTGDPHLTTLEGLSYDYMTAEDTVLLRGETTGGHRLLVNARQVPVGDSSAVTINNATATALGADTVVIRADAEEPLSISGEAVPLASGEAVSVGDGGEVRKQGSTYTVVYPGPDDEATPGDEHLTVHRVGNRLDIEACLHANRTAPVEGLLGTPNDDPDDDIALQNGTALDQPLDTDILYGPFRTDWAATGDENLFPTRYGIEDFPREIVTVDDLSEAERERAAGVLEDTCLEPGTAQYRDALIDVALTGDSSYVSSACRETREGVVDATNPNFPPTATFSAEPDGPVVGETVTFDASDSDDADGTVVEYGWDLDGDGEYDDATGVTAITTYDDAGTVTVGLRIEDDDGETATAETELDVLEQPNSPPTASFSVDPAEPEVGETVTFDASGSTDPDGTIVSYEWDLDGDGEYDDATGVTATTTYDDAGEVTVALRVVDDVGATATADTSLTVSERSNIVAPGQPGFGAILAGVALLLIGLFARRRA